ncbi:hypothetical protein HPB47_022787 [Ixodes persulcatus]|uniref:Uncharacterized protein n=1 Tax=Ixodes persulcatus TaxID=34615 RepID=A0AC60Q9V0_IXOPE|nr:hypothetical protein HPB47_022787 [Ixodes persulcatus]
MNGPTFPQLRDPLDESPSARSAGGDDDGPPELSCAVDENCILGPPSSSSGAGSSSLRWPDPSVEAALYARLFVVFVGNRRGGGSLFPPAASVPAGAPPSSPSVSRCTPFQLTMDRSGRYELSQPIRRQRPLRSIVRSYKKRRWWSPGVRDCGGRVSDSEVLDDCPGGHRFGARVAFPEMVKKMVLVWMLPEVLRECGPISAGRYCSSGGIPSEMGARG